MRGLIATALFIAAILKFCPGELQIKCILIGLIGFYILGVTVPPFQLLLRQLTYIVILPISSAPSVLIGAIPGIGIGMLIAWIRGLAFSWERTLYGLACADAIVAWIMLASLKNDIKVRIDSGRVEERTGNTVVAVFTSAIMMIGCTGFDAMGLLVASGICIFWGANYVVSEKRGGDREEISDGE